MNDEYDVRVYVNVEEGIKNQPIFNAFATDLRELRTLLYEFFLMTAIHTIKLTGTVVTMTMALVSRWKMGSLLGT